MCFPLTYSNQKSIWLEINSLPSRVGKEFLTSLKAACFETLCEIRALEIPRSGPPVLLVEV